MSAHPPTTCTPAPGISAQLFHRILVSPAPPSTFYGASRLLVLAEGRLARGCEEEVKLEQETGATLRHFAKCVKSLTAGEAKIKRKCLELIDSMVRRANRFKSYYSFLLLNTRSRPLQDAA